MKALALALLAIGTLWSQSQPTAVLLLTSLKDAPNTPTDSPGMGTYSSTQSVTLSDATATFILYTTNGSTPACPATGTLYTVAFNISVTTTLKAIGCNGITPSGSVLTSVYTITSYSGPGDVTSGALAWWGLRAYSAGTAGNKAANVCNAGDANCADVKTLMNGNFDVTTAQGSPLNCGGAGGTCTIKTLYDQTGSTNCSGSVACDITQATISLRPALTFNCSGSLPCMAWTSLMLLRSVNLSAGRSQPYTASAVGERTGNFSSFSDLVGSNAGVVGQLGFANAANTALLYGGTVATKASVNDNAFHAMQGLFSGASSVLYVDGSSSTVNAGTSSLAAADVCMGLCNNGLVGNSMEGGFWPSDTSANFSTMNTNQHTYWGF